ncbi:MAG: hypothetical protein ACK4PI_14435 [Tepidisphaerales bacterium]
MAAVYAKTYARDDSDIAEVVELWSKLTRAQRAAVLAMVRTMAD